MTDLLESAHRVEGPRAAGGRLMREGVGGPAGADRKAEGGA